MGDAHWSTQHMRQHHLLTAVSRVPAKLLRDGLRMEFGTRHGDALRWLAKPPSKGIHHYNYNSSGAWHGFDSWEGLPAEVAAGGSTSTKPSSHHWRGSQYSTHGKLPDVRCCPGVKLHRGWFNDTLPPFMKLHAGQPVAFLHCDADIYSSTLTVLEEVFSRCGQRVGTVIAFDELFGSAEQEQHELRALLETATRHGVTFRFITYALVPSSPFGRAAVQVLSVGKRCERELGFTEREASS